MRFEKSEAYRRSKNLTVDVYRNTQKLKDFGFRDQITRSALSIPSNIAEGLERKTDKDLAHFLTMAKASSAEFKAQAMIGAEIGYIDSGLATRWQKEASEIGSMLGAFIKTLARG